jgi:hypothetical protein
LLTFGRSSAGAGGSGKRIVRWSSTATTSNDHLSATRSRISRIDPDAERLSLPREEQPRDRDRCCAIAMDDGRACGSIARRLLLLLGMRAS